MPKPDRKPEPQLLPVEDAPLRSSPVGDFQGSSLPLATRAARPRSSPGLFWDSAYGLASLDFDEHSVDESRINFAIFDLAQDLFEVVEPTVDELS